MRHLVKMVGVALFALPGFACAETNTWTGFYAGLSYSFASGETGIVGNRFTYNQNSNPNIVDHDYDGSGLGAVVGWNRQVGDVVYGFELAVQDEDLSSDLVFNSDNDIDRVDIAWSGALTGRIGQVAWETLFYLRGGIAFAQIENVGGDVNGGTLTLSDAHINDDMSTGPLIGIGAERFVHDNVILRLEYNRSDFGRFRQANQDGVPGSQVYRIENGPVERVSLAVMYQF